MRRDEQTIMFYTVAGLQQCVLEPIFSVGGELSVRFHSAPNAYVVGHHCDKK